MSQVKVAIIYYSATGTIHSMAERVATFARSAGAEVRLRRVEELAPLETVSRNQAWADHARATQHIDVASADDVVWADGVLFGTPTRFGNVASQLKQFLDTLGPQWSEGLLADKAYAGFTATQTAHGGQESTLLALYNSVYHFGGVLVPPGYTDPLKFVDGNPYGVSHVTGQSNREPLGTPQVAALEHLANRVVRVSGMLRGVLASTPSDA
ncbi:MAG TPA: NAD(P)H:quinone oxidoreductase [Nocardioides sp.]|uniref:NAD(P)H:quinone oxidoreductase n=1 Tax=uncultured Nocardioides sp. TaxID=198441 RepID=UPI000EE88D96|nr:NAD(P)H:quinone oxidoreductase [uncultured Nocardioides sp.]HCB02866.1 NAD(P)H dehydrogenase [Nocardioides sp.]HRI94835.1 NAD(P)H:quinone oxidoreductase [Nocardioides sp.]HRK44906.1 NAD(P)H:quinone oxidoreductase [Nocardioides sp.]